MNKVNKSNQLQTFLFTIIFFFFLQSFGRWVESIYDLSMVKTSLGSDSFSILLIFLPLALLVVPKPFEARFLKIIVPLSLILPVLCCFLSMKMLMLTTGVSVGVSIIVLAYAFSGRFGLTSTQLTSGIVFALFLTILIRSFGSTVDISILGKGVFISVSLAVIGFILHIKNGLYVNDEATEGSQSFVSVVGVMVGIICNIFFIYMFLSSPGVISAWVGGEYLLYLMLILASWCLVLAKIKVILPLMTSAIVLSWNSIFIICLVGGLVMNTPEFPMTADSPAWIQTLPSHNIQTLLYLMCVFSPIIFINLLILFKQDRVYSPKQLVTPMLIATLILLLLVILHIFSNTWGYIGDLSKPLRGKFHLPFLISGVFIIITVFLAQKKRKVNNINIQFPIGLIGLVAVISIGNVYKLSYSTDYEQASKKQMTIMTYNMRMGSDKKARSRLEEQREFIKSINPDIIGLQESDTARPGGGQSDIPRYYAEQLGYNYYYGPTSIGNSFGTAILSRYPIENPRSIYSFSRKDEIATAAIEIQVGDRRILFLNNHPAGKKTRTQHIQAILEQAASFEHVISVGDYNARQYQAPYQMLIAAGYQDSWLSIYPDAIGKRHPTIGTPSHDKIDEPLNMYERIDHIITSKTFVVKEAFFVPVPESMSDHPAHWAVLSWE